MAAIPRLAENSPTATLLRNSRLFSLPTPLPRPNQAIHHNDRIKNSDTATTPYPTHQIIATSDASRSRGDWGLKRPLPMKSTFKSRGIRMHSLDTTDEITEFENARDHLMTLKKLQELNLSLTRYSQGRKSYGRLQKHKSAFDEAYDHTAPRSLTLEESAFDKYGDKTPLAFQSKEIAEEIKRTNNKLPQRWRMRGPDLKDMPEAEFNRFVENEVSSRKGAFMTYLKSCFARTLAKTYWDNYREKGAVPTLEDKYHEWLSELSVQQVEAYLRVVMPVWMDAPKESDTATPAWIPKIPTQAPTYYGYLKDSKLRERYMCGLIHPTKMIELPIYEDGDQELIDEKYSAADITRIVQGRAAGVESAFLPIIEQKWQKWFIEFRNTSGSDPTNRHIIEYFLDLPVTIPSHNYDVSVLSTHPSAGLSYRRSSRIIRNDPLFGPVRGPIPHKAIVLPNGPVGIRFADSERNGLAGVIITGTSGSGPISTESSDKIGHVGKTYDAATGVASAPLRGFKKGWVSVELATISADGRIKIEASKTNAPQVMIAEEELENSMKADQLSAANGPLSDVQKAPRAQPIFSSLLDNSSLPFVRDGRIAEPLDEAGRKQYQAGVGGNEEGAVEPIA